MKSKMPIILILLGAFLGRATAQLAGPIVNPVNGNYYYLLDQTTWIDAEQTALSLGGHLATITNAAENQWILETFSQYGGLDRNLWIGLNDRQVEGTFEWSSGDAVSYTNWEPGQPDDLNGIEDAAFMWPLSSPVAGNWADAPDSIDAWAHGVVEVVPPATQIQAGVNVSWGSISNLTYQVQYSLTLSSNSWTNLGPALTATGTNTSVFDPFGISEKRFYRVVQSP